MMYLVHHNGNPITELWHDNSYWCLPRFTQSGQHWEMETSNAENAKISLFLFYHYILSFIYFKIR